MGKGFDFIKDIANQVIDEKALNYGVCKAIDILLDLNTEDEKIKLMLVKHFDITYSVAERVLKEAKQCCNK